jgi:demethylmenaquinone methyltransferase/2-methoxy-6-polyprenyl-1,4-benzoquinol methylase
MEKNNITPYINKNEDPSRKDVWQMFNRISSRYDFLNRLLSLGQDVVWRKRICQYLPDQNCLKLLDVACGTADVLISVYKSTPQKVKLIGIDLAKSMLELGRRKVYPLKSNQQITLIPADALSIPFKAESFDAVTIAFGIRNVVNLTQALDQMFQVLKPHGRLLILEFSLPENKIIQRLYLIYFRKILPRIGAVISGDRKAYYYLNKTVETFPFNQALVKIIKSTGFKKVDVMPLTFGIVSLYIADKK